MGKTSVNFKGLIIALLCFGALLFYTVHHWPKSVSPAPPLTAEELKRREEIALLYPPNALKDPFEYEYHESRVRYDYISILGGSIRGLFGAIGKGSDRDTLSPVLTKKAAPADAHEDYWKIWAIKLYGEGAFYRKLALFRSRSFVEEIPQYKAAEYKTCDWGIFSKEYARKALALNDPMTWYYFALRQLQTRWKRGGRKPGIYYEYAKSGTLIITDTTESAKADLGLPDMTPFEAMQKAAELGSAPAQLWVGDVYCLGIDTRDPEDIKRGYAHELIEVNPELAMQYRQQALDNGEREALYNIAMSYFHGTCLPKNKTLALAYLSAYGGSPLVRQDLYDSLSKEERQKARSKTIELADKLAAVRDQRDQEEREHYRQWLRDMRADVKANLPWVRWAFVPEKLYERIKPELIQAALDKGLAKKGEDGKVYAVREITWAEYMEMDRENRVRKWEALSEEEKKTYPRPE